MSNLVELEELFYLEISQTTDNYSSNNDLRNLSEFELWTHANNFGYKEQRNIFNNPDYNEEFYSIKLNTLRTEALSIDNNFDWKIYLQNYTLTINSEYYALLDFIDRSKLGVPTTSVKGHYTIIGEQSSYEKDKFMFQYGSGKLSTDLFGMVIPVKSKLLRGYFIYHYDDEEETCELSYNTYVKLRMYINGSKTNNYIEETLDLDKNMVIGTFKSENVTDAGIIINNTPITIEQNSIISWYCEDVYSQTNNNIIQNPNNPSRNRFIIVLENI